MCGLLNSVLSGEDFPRYDSQQGEQLVAGARMEEKLNVRKHTEYSVEDMQKYKVLLLYGIRSILVEIPANNMRNIWRQTGHQPSDSFALSVVADAYEVWSMGAECLLLYSVCLSQSKPWQRVARHFGPWVLDDPSFPLHRSAHTRTAYPFVASQPLMRDRLGSDSCPVGD